jgi:hypothetical protein
VTEQQERSADGDRHMGTADRRTLESIFRHPVTRNLNWTDVLHVLNFAGTAEERSDGKYSIQVNGKHLVFHKPHDKHLDAHEIRKLRDFLVAAGLSPSNDLTDADMTVSPLVDIVLVIDHHEARLYEVYSSSDQRPETVRPYDPHHFRHHLHHRAELHEHGQRPAEDLSFYERISEALARADRILVLHHGSGTSNAAHVLIERLQKHYPDIYARIVVQARVDSSAMTEAEILAYARQALVADPRP